MLPCYRRFLRWAFTRFYREFAWTYDTVAALVSRGLWRRWIETATAHVHGERVLELGSGTGYLQRALGHRGVWSVGLEVSPQMIRLARRKIARAGLTPRLIHGDARLLPFADGSFSDVVATFPTDYILDPRTLREARRVLRPGGQLLVIDAAFFTKRDAYAAAVEIAYRATGQAPRVDPRPALFASAGFAPDESWEPVGASLVQVLRGIKCDSSGVILGYHTRHAND